ncbi:hypothetical protein [Chryseobacterium aquaticum]|uniref:Beta-carotene 15,15'-monooxygenase n=1 Tax=Chryseobacterium aquaticum subsp. greenlandense TaxID=345663 RepID=A0A124F2S1_9FLAO|nr:hypothetical protein [Chryseobacterium aquaticum]KUJ55679.1 hypothetical protein AR686_12800 [Chryseobacterium aquaticum subsp. greenlandense]
MSRKLLLVFLYLYALIFSVLKTARFPNEWAESHWLLDYRFGFIKRGLAGEIFGWFFRKNEWSIALLSAAILIFLYVLIFRIAVKETFRNENSFPRILFFLIFFLSQYVVFSAHLIGYFDHVVFLLTILVITLINRKKFFAASLVAVFSIFIHEISFFLMLPISFFALIVSECQNKKFSFGDIFSKSILSKLALLFVLPVITTISISFFQEINDENYFSIIFNYLKQTLMISDEVAGSVSSAYTKSFTYYFEGQKGHFIQRLFISKCTIYYGIPIAFCLWMIFREFNLKKNIQLFIVLTTAAFVPLLLHAIAYDTYRIWSFPFMVLFLSFWILSSKEITVKKEEVKRLSSVEIIFFIFSFLLIFLIPNELFDGETERFYLPVRLILMLPVFLILYFLKKPQSKID